MHKKDFPIFKRKVYDQELIYLDNAATSQKPLAVLQAMESFYRESYANVHRGIYSLSEEATSLYEEVRSKVASFINAERGEIVFTRGTTEGLNFLASSLGRQLNEGDEIIISEMEHHSNLVPWQQLCQEKKLKLHFIPVTKSGNLDLDQYKKLLSKKTKIVSVIHMSNVIGTINDIKKICKLAHEVGASCIVDGAQSIAHMKIDVKDIDCDYFVFSGHKMLGPTGIGVVYGKKEQLEELSPWHYGGQMVDSVTLEKSTFADVPARFEAGTPAIAEVVGLGAAIDYLEKIGMDKIAEYDREITRYALEKLQQVAGIDIFGGENRAAVISFIIEGVHAYDIAALLDKKGICVRAGSLCALPLLSKFGVESVVRVSFHLYNAKKEVDNLVEGLKRIVEVCHGKPKRS